MDVWRCIQLWIFLSQRSLSSSLQPSLCLSKPRSLSSFASHQQKLLSLNMLFFFNVFQHAIFFFNMLFFISTCYFFPASFSTCYFLQVHFWTCYFMFSTCYFFLHQFQHAIFSTCYFCTWLFNMLNSAKPYLNMLFFISIAMLAWWTPHGEWVLTTWEDGLVPSI